MINFMELKSNDYAQGVILVFFAGVLWSTVGLGIRLIENAGVWQILFYRSISLTLLLYFVTVSYTNLTLPTICSV